MNTSSVSPRKPSVHHQESSEGTNNAYDALRFLRTTNKWGEHFDFEYSIKVLYHSR
jgi:hypothetical protein